MYEVLYGRPFVLNVVLIKSLSHSSEKINHKIGEFSGGGRRL